LRQEPKPTDAIYQEIEECEPYALLNLITFEMTIRNSEVKKMIDKLNKMPIHESLNFDSEYQVIRNKLKEKYLFDYLSYKDYKQNQHQDIILHVSHQKHFSHTHHLALPLHRPFASIPQQQSCIEIRVPIYHIHPKDIENYYQKLMESHKAVIEDAKKYYNYVDLFYDEVNKSKNKANTYATMFFVWDYLQWATEQGDIAPQETKRGLYAEITKIIKEEVNDTTGRSSKVEKYIEIMNKLIEKCEYKKFYFKL
jgi:hypothetical protein